MIGIGSIAPLSYTPGRLEYFQFVRGGTGADYHQGPTFYLFPNGDLMIYWWAYDFDECSPNAISLYSVSKDKGITWSVPQVYMADYPGGQLGGLPMLRLHGSLTTLMFVAQTRHKIETDEEHRVATVGSNYFEAQTRIYVRRSTDGGRSFDYGEQHPYIQITGGKSLPEVGFYGSVDTLIQLQSGRIVAAFQFMDPERSDAGKRVQHYTTVCMLSDDGGRTWTRSSEITADTPRGAMESQIVETEPDRLLCLFRTKSGYIYQSVSEDGGETWGKSEPTSLPSPESMVRMIKLLSGKLLVVWNNVSSTTQDPRHPLAATLSGDGGHTWSNPRIIADETGSNQLSNHGLIQLDDGRILLGISHYRDVRPMTSDLDVAIFDEEWLQAK
jgi:Neuraminidase (sialidase)